MRNPVAIEDIEELRRSEGIEDVELRQAIRKLGIGDFVKVTLVASPTSFETLRVRITSIRGAAFRGKLARQPITPGLTQLHVGFPLVFTTTHIHSLERAPTLKKLSDGLLVIHPPSRMHPPAKRTAVSAKTKSRAARAVVRPLAQTPARTTAECLQRIAALGQRVNGYVQFMCQAGNPNNASAEATDRAIVAFYEEMVLLESRLGRIHSDFTLA